MSSRITGAGDFISWDGGCLFIGRAHHIVPVHAHYAIQIAFGSEPGIQFRASDDDTWTSYDGAIIASRQPHSMDARHVTFDAVLFVEPETREGRALSERYLPSGIVSLGRETVEALAKPLFSAWQDQRTEEAIVHAARGAIQTFTGGIIPRVVSDERVLRAVAYIRSHLEGALTLEEVAGEACLSPSRFRHLFVEETGMALRPYILWHRFLRVWDLLMDGASISSAAHAAGFADAAHLTRTSRQMFGFPPSALQMTGPIAVGEEGVALPPLPPPHLSSTEGESR